MLIVTYNIQWGKGRDGRIDLARIASAVAGADVIALQEVERHWRTQDHPDQAQRLAELLPGHHWVFGPAVDLKGDGPGRRRQIGNMTLARFPISSTRNVPLPARPVPGHMNDQQALLEAVIEEEDMGLRIYNTHLNYLSEEQRREQIGTIVQFIAEAPARGGPITMPGKEAPGPDDDWIVLPDGKLPGMPKPAVLLGDFNAGPETREYRTLAAQLVDTLKPAGSTGSAVTFPGGGREPPQRLDYCFVTADLGARVRRSWIDADADGSDHQPVWAEIDFSAP